MARDKGTLTNIDNTNPANYPNGRIKDNTGAGDGTEVNEFVYGDIHEFFAKAMRLYGILFSGTPDNETNGYQYIEAVKALATKNDYVLALTSSSADVLSIPLKLNFVLEGEFFICRSEIDKAAQTKITGSLDTTASEYNVNFIGGDFATGDFLRIIRTASGFDVIRLPQGSAFSGVALAEGFLKAATQSQENDGTLNTVGTTPLTNLAAFIRRVNGDDSSNYLVISNSNANRRDGLMSKEDKQKLDSLGTSRSGSITINNIQSTATGVNYPVTGDIQQATVVSAPVAANLITVTLTTAMPNTSYFIRQSIRSNANFDRDNKINLPIFKVVNTSQFQLFVQAPSSIAGSISITTYIEVIPI